MTAGRRAAAALLLLLLPLAFAVGASAADAPWAPPPSASSQQAGRIINLPFVPGHAGGSEVIRPMPKAPVCTELKEGQMGSGKLCTTQWVTLAEPVPGCQPAGAPACVREVTRLVKPATTDELNAAALAACRLMGYTSETKAVYTLPSEGAGEATCWDGKEWIKATYWTSLTCCK